MANLVRRTPTVAAVSFICKAFLNSPFCSVTVNGLPTLLNALDSEERKSGRGVVTVCNHISTLDDPVMWGILPARTWWSTQTTRWALGASDVMFTNPLFSAFFRGGQVLETFRGKGIYQPAVDTAIEKLDQGQWVHLFGEGKINQRRTFEKDHDVTLLPRFKWGVGRILMETNVPPVVIPMWLTGFDNLMPEGRKFPWNYVPRLGVKLSITIGEPIAPEDIQAALRVISGEDVIRHKDSSVGPSRNPVSEAHKGAESSAVNNDDKLFGIHHEDRIREGVTSKAIRMDMEDASRKQTIDKVRSLVTAVVQRSVETLGRRVSGDNLGKMQDI